MPRLPFLGQGIGFPFRLDTSKGGARITYGSTDHVSVSLSYLQDDRWSISENVIAEENHIAEAIAHILATHPGEHDTLPSFGGQALDLVFSPNHPAFHLLAEHYFTHSTERWEKRAKIPEGQITFTWDGELVERGTLPVKAMVQFIVNQVEGNLISPFSSPREARNAEYQTGTLDKASHDWLSRYKNYDVYRYGDKEYIRPRYPEFIPPANDDVFYKVKAGDTWLLVADNVYGDIRYHWLVTQVCYIDAARNGLSRTNMANLLGDPTPGDYLRLPTRNRALMGIIQ